MSYKDIYSNAKLPDLDEKFTLEECSNIKECVEELEDIFIMGIKNDLISLGELISRLF